MTPSSPRVAAILVVLLAGPLLAGCLRGDDTPAPIDRPDWQVGDRWIYKRSSTGGAPDTVYVREVTGLVEKRGHETFEVREGIRGHPIHQYLLYTVDDLRLAGMDVRDGNTLVQRLDPQRPLVFHYVFPLASGHRAAQDGIIDQTAGALPQRDTVHIEAEVGTPHALTLGERVYQVWPYEIRITYTTTPFDETAIVRGHWAPAVGQSVLTTIDEAGGRRTYELLSFERQAPRNGPPAYELVPGLQSRRIDRGFDAVLTTPGFARYLFHVETPTDVGVTFSFPTAPGWLDRLDLAAIRPIGYARAGISHLADDIARDGVVLHLAAHTGGPDPFLFHAPDDPGLDAIRLQPGVIYELLLASNHGGLSARLSRGAETQALAPAETGAVDIVALNRSRVQEATPPGPQNIRHTLTTIVSLPQDARVEGLVYARNHGGEAQSLGELNALRGVRIDVETESFDDDEALYGFYMHYGRGEPFRIDATYQYHADLAVQGYVDYELGSLLLRLRPRA